MTEQTHITTLQRTLAEYRQERRRIETRLAELKQEVEHYTAQLDSFELMIEQAAGALRRALFPYEEPPETQSGGGRLDARYDSRDSRSEPRREPRYDARRDQSRYDQYEEPRYEEPRSAPRAGPRRDQPRYDPHYEEPRQEQPSYRPLEVSSPHRLSDPPAAYRSAEPTMMHTADLDEAIEYAHRDEQQSNIRFADFRIPQAATIVLREARAPLHVSEIYRRLSEGGFEFRGQHQLITLAVSLSRSKRFRKVAPGTFELDPAYRAGQVA
jgi:hypothetical protein